jgi:LPS-assembly lipoprotein
MWWFEGPGTGSQGNARHAHKGWQQVLRVVQADRGAGAVAPEVRLAAGRRSGLFAAVAGGMAFAVLPLLPACGFQLRQPPKLAFSSIALQGFAHDSSFAVQLKRELLAQVRVLEDASKAAVVLQVLEDRRDRSVVAQTSAAQVRDLQLRLTFRFRVTTATGREVVPRAELLAKRELSYSETAALAKAMEEADLYREMQTDLVAQVMRRLASVVA